MVRRTVIIEWLLDCMKSVYPKRYLAGHRMFTSINHCATLQFQREQDDCWLSWADSFWNEEEILQHFHVNLRMSIRAGSSKSTENSESLRSIGANYTILKVQALFPADYRPCQQFARRFLRKDIFQSAFSSQTKFILRGLDYISGIQFTSKLNINEHSK